MSKIQIDDAQIREAAFHLWLSEGKPDGRAEDHWYRAHDALTKTTAKAPAKRRAAVKPKAAIAAKPRSGRKASAKT